MSGVNKVILIGRLGKDPEVRNLDNGSSVASFSIAVTESWKDKTTGEKKESTEWVNVVAWRQLAELAGKYLHKGDQVYVEGKLKTRSYEKDNTTRYVTEVVLDSMTMLSGGRSNSGSPQAQTQTATPGNSYSAPVDSSTDDLPF